MAGRHRHRAQGVQQGALPGHGQKVPDPLLQPLPALRPSDHHRQRVPGEPGARRLQADRVHRPAVPRRQGRVPDPRLQDRRPPARRPGPGGGPTAGPVPDRCPAELQRHQEDRPGVALPDVRPGDGVAPQPGPDQGPEEADRLAHQDHREGHRVPAQGKRAMRLVRVPGLLPGQGARAQDGRAAGQQVP